MGRETTKMFEYHFNQRYPKQFLFFFPIFITHIFLPKGENINITWSPDGNTIAVGNKEDLITFIDMRTLKSNKEQQFNFEVNEMSWNNESDLFFLTNGLGCIYVLR